MKKKNASSGFRIVAGFIDLLVFLLVCQTAIMPFISVNSPSGILASLIECMAVLLLISIFFSFFNPYLISKYGGTVGKIICRLSIVTPEGKPVSYKRAFFRSTVGYSVSNSFLFLGFLWIFKDGKKRGWHDMVSETEVIEKEKGSVLMSLVALMGLLVLNMSVLNMNMIKVKNQMPIYQEAGEVIRREISPPTPSPYLPSYRF